MTRKWSFDGSKSKMPCPPDLIKDDDNSLAYVENSKLFKWLSGNIPGVRKVFQGPVLEGFSTKSNVNKGIVNELFKHDFILKKFERGVTGGTPLEIMNRTSHEAAVKTVNLYNKIYRETVGVKTDLGAVIEGRLLKKKPSIDKFSEWTEKANRRAEGGLEEFMTKSEIEAYGAGVIKAAKLSRKFMDETKKMMDELAEFYPKFKEEYGRLSKENPMGAVSYFTRRYSLSRIAQLRTPDGKFQFKEMLREEFGKNIKDKGELEKEVNKVFNNVRNQGDTNLNIDDWIDSISSNKPLPSVLKDRTLNIPDKVLEPWLEHDAMNIMFHHRMRVAGLLNTKKKLAEMGYVDVGDMKKAIRDDYNKLIENELDPKQINKLEVEMREAIQGVEDNLNILNNRFGTRELPMLQKLRKYNVLTMLGGVLISSIPDMAMNIFKHGASATWKDGVVLFNQELKKNTKLTNEGLADLGMAFEVEMNNILRAYEDPHFRVTGLSDTQFDKILDFNTSLFSHATGLQIWNSMWTRMGARITGASIVRKFQKGLENLSNSEISELARIGIGREQYKIVQRNLKHVVEADGAVFPMAHKWDEEGMELMRNAMVRNQSILRPGAGQIPKMFLANDIMITLFQFKSFMSAAFNDITTAGAQRIAGKFQNEGALAAAGSKEVQGLLTLIALGSAVYTVKELMAGREPSTDLDTLIMEGMLRSGVLGLIGETLVLLPGGPRSAKYAGMNAAGLTGGPSQAQAIRLIESFHSLDDGYLTDKEVDKLRRFIPYNNLFYISAMMKGMR